jgi:hypothetical protein
MIAAYSTFSVPMAAQTARIRMKELFKIPAAIVPIVLGGLAFAFNWIKGMLSGRPQYITLITNVENALTRIVQALADSDPDDTGQIDGIMQDFLNEDVSDWTDDQILIAADKISNPHIKAYFLSMAPAVVEVLRLSTDENPENQAQIQAHFGNYLRSDDTKQLFADHLVQPGLTAAADWVDPQTV